MDEQALKRKYKLFPPRNIGILKPGQKRKVHWDIPEGMEIVNAFSRCDCTNPEFKDGQIIVTFTAGGIPLHLMHQGWYAKETRIDIWDQDKNHYLLTIQVEIQKHG